MRRNLPNVNGKNVTIKNDTNYNSDSNNNNDNDSSNNSLKRLKTSEEVFEVRVLSAVK